jgi:cytosine/uracil/thiamine/allantoin permease
VVECRCCCCCYVLLQVGIVVRGIDTIKELETCSAPILVALAAALLVWALTAAGGLGPMLAAPSQASAAGYEAHTLSNHCNDLNITLTTPWSTSL